VALNSGKGTCTIADTALAVGTYPVSATYGGDASLNGSCGSSVSKLIVSKDTTSTTVSESPTSVTYGHESASVSRSPSRATMARQCLTAETVTVTVVSVTAKWRSTAARDLPRSPEHRPGRGARTPVSATYGGDAPERLQRLELSKPDREQATPRAPRVSESPTSVTYGHDRLPVSRSQSRPTMARGSA